MKLKLKAKAVEQKSGFEPYDGPEPSRRGFYRAVIKKFQYGKKKSDSMGFFIVAELEAAKGDPKDHAKFDGYPMFSRNIITESSDGSALKEGAQRNLSNLLAALGTGDDPDVVLAKDGDPTAGMVDVLKIGKKNPVGAIINIDMDFETYADEKRPSVGGIYKFKDDGAAPAKGKPKFEEDEDDEDDESDLMDSDEEASEVDERAAELDEMKTTELRKLAKELGVKSSGNKESVIEAILDAEFPSEEDEEDDESEDEDEPEEDESEDEEDEEDDEEDDEDEAQTARAEELQGFDRAALKKILKEIAPDFTVMKRHSDEDLREAILNVEFSEDTPF